MHLPGCWPSAWPGQARTRRVFPASVAPEPVGGPLADVALHPRHEARQQFSLPHLFTRVSKRLDAQVVTPAALARDRRIQQGRIEGPADQLRPHEEPGRLAEEGLAAPRGSQRRVLIGHHGHQPRLAPTPQDLPQETTIRHHLCTEAAAQQQEYGIPERLMQWLVGSEGRMADVQ